MTTRLISKKRRRRIKWEGEKKECVGRKIKVQFLLLLFCFFSPSSKERAENWIFITAARGGGGGGGVEEVTKWSKGKRGEREREIEHFSEL